MKRGFYTESLQHLSLEEYAEYLPPDSSSTETNFKELVKLTTRPDANFRISGTPDRFVIETKSFNWLIIPVLLIFQVLPIIVVINRPDLAISWAFPAASVLGPLIGIRYSKTSNDIFIDTGKQTIFIRSNNVIGKYIIPKKVIDLEEIVELETKQRIMSGGNGPTAKWMDISAITREGKIHIISLPTGPLRYVNFVVFQRCLERIIKNDT